MGSSTYRTAEQQRCNKGATPLLDADWASKGDRIFDVLAPRESPRRFSGPYAEWHKGAMLLLDALERLRVDINHGVQTVDALPHVLRSAAARSENLRNEAQRRGISWLHGIRLGQEHSG